MAGSVIGLDFGTTNSLIAYIDGREEAARTLTNQADGRPHPSTVWYRASAVIVGRDARSQLESGGDAVSGSFIRSPKRLIDREAPVDVDGTPMDSRDVVAAVLRFLKEDAADSARGASARDVQRAVMTIPVDLDGPGRRRLREAARKAGIGVVQFVHEPLAALYAWLRASAQYADTIAQFEGRRILVFDWGGGTLDLTLCQIRNHRLVQIANAGDNEVGGDFFDALMRNHVRELHAQEHGLADIQALETADSRNRLLVQCEQAKIALSTESEYFIGLRNYLRCETGRHLNVSVTRQELVTWTEDLVSRGLSQIDRLLEANGLTPQEVELCLPTGGMVNIPAVRDGLIQRFGARVPLIENGDSIIAEGAAWIAHDLLRLSLAKPIELAQPDGSYLELVSEGHILPIENQTSPIVASQFYCVDPRDGFARFDFARPAKIGYGARSAPRQTYATLSVAVDPLAQPFLERLKINITIDHDYIVTVSAHSSGRGDQKSAQIHNLEFALELPGNSIDPFPFQADNEVQGFPSSEGEMAAKLRTNVSAVAQSWSSVPGDIIEKWRPNWFDLRSDNASSLQRSEHEYYIPCAICKRSICDIQLGGCDSCPTVISVQAAATRRSELGII